MVRFQTGAAFFSLHHLVQTGSGAHPSCYPVSTGGKAAERREVLPSPPSTAKVKNAGSSNFTPHYVSLHFF